MKRIVRHRPSAAMIVAIVAVVLATAGSAAAAHLITGKQIKNNSITTKDIKNRSLLKKDFKRGQLPRGATGPRGPQGPQGLRGPAGANGRNGTNGFGVVSYNASNDATFTSNTATATAPCLGDLVPMGGGIQVYDTKGTLDVIDDTVVRDSSVTIGESAPDFDAIGWTGTVSSTTTTNRVAVAWVACANADTIAKHGTRR